MSAGRWRRPARRGTAPAAVAAEQNDVEFRSGIPAGGLLRLMQQPELFDAGGVPITLPSTDEVFYDPILEISKRWDGSQWRIAGNGTYAPLASPALTGTPTLNGSSVTTDRLWTPTDPFPPRDGATRSPITTFQSGHGWALSTADASANANNTSSPVIGSQYASIVTQGLGVGTPARFTKTGLTVDLTGKQVWLLCRITNSQYLSNLQFYAGPSGFPSYYIWQLDRWLSAAAGAWLRDGVWTWLPFGFENATTSGTPTKSGITDLRVAVIDTGGGKVTLDVAAVATIPDPTSWAWPNGVISFTCDDGWATQYTIGRGILDGYLYPATAYVIADQSGNVGASTLGSEGPMSVGQLQSLQGANRWEIGAHSSTLATHNAGLSTLSISQLDQEFATMKQWLHDNDLYGGDHLAYPLGDYNPQVLERAKRYFTTARTVNDFAQDTYPAGDRHRLRVLQLNNAVTLATAKAKVDACLAAGNWLIIVFHRLDPVTATSITWLTADFQSLVDYIATKNIPVRTVSSVMGNRAGEVLRAIPATYATPAKAQSALSMSAVIRSGAATVANNVLPPGIRAGYTTTLSAIYVRCGTAPTGSGLTVRVNQNGTGIQTLTIAAAGTSQSATGLTIAVAAGDVFTFDITAIGSTIAGSDIAVDLVGS